MKKTIFILAIGSLVLSSCFKRHYPEPLICPDEPVTIRTIDTLVLENCSKYTSEIRWELPDGGFSTQQTVRFTNSTPGDYYIYLKAKNKYYANDYITERKVTVVLP